VLAALADGESKIIRPLRADDTDKLLAALCTLGAEARWDGEDVYIKGVNGRFPRGGEVNLGDGGAPTRFMIAVACLAAEPVVVDGSKRMRERPIAEGVDMLRKLGATIEYVEDEGRLPVRVVPSETFKGGEIEIGETVSSQFISALMLIGRSLRDGLKIKFVGPVISKTYLLLTTNVLGHWLTPESNLGDELWNYLTRDIDTLLSFDHGKTASAVYRVESDASGAAYWFAAAALSNRSRAAICELGTPAIQPDMLMVRELMHKNLIDVTLNLLDAGECRWLLERGRKTGKLKSDCSLFPDGAMALAMVAAMMKNKSRLTGLHTLRHKETDRIAALANELRKIGCTIETTDDSITIDPSTRHNDPVVIETYNDHRMAMAFGVLGLARPGISISNPACVSKSYPTFWHDFAKLYQ